MPASERQVDSATLPHQLPTLKDDDCLNFFLLYQRIMVPRLNIMKNGQRAELHNVFFSFCSRPTSQCAQQVAESCHCETSKIQYGGYFCSKTFDVDEYF